MKTSTLSRKLITFGAGLLIANVAIAQTPDLGKLSNEGKTIKYVAIGSSLSAGVRDGGVYAEAQQTSFPALLAQQMGISDFKQPLLEGNGTGRKSVTKDKFGNLKFTEIKSLDDKSPNAKLPKIIGEVDNLAVPYLKLLDIYEASSDQNPFVDKRSFKYLDRLLTKDEEGRTSYLSFVGKLKDTNFFTYEIGFQDYVEYISSGGLGTSILYMGGRESYGETEVLSRLVNKKINGIIANVPDVLSFPIYKYFKNNKLQEQNEVNSIFISYLSGTGTRIANQNDLFLPTQNIINLFDKNFPANKKLGLSIETPLRDSDILSSDELETISIKGYNTAIITPLAKKYNLPIVDLYGLYEKIMIGNYETIDGVLIDPSYPYGNFFSADGTTPTALGQAVIANEFIQVINTTYSCNIPLVNTKDYLNK